MFAAMFVAITIVSGIDILNYAKHVHLRLNVGGRDRIPSRDTVVFPNHFNPFWLIEFPACEWDNRGSFPRSRVRYHFDLAKFPVRCRANLLFDSNFADNASRKTRICPRSDRFWLLKNSRESPKCAVRAVKLHFIVLN